MASRSPSTSSGAPPRSTPPASRRALHRGRLTTLAVVLALALGACGGDDSSEETTTENVLGSVAALAQCSDWNERTEDERLATIENIREQINLEEGPVQTPALDDEQAYELFENACSESGSETHRLYVIYGRAAGFSSLLGD